MVIASKNRGKVAEIMARFAHLPIRIVSLAECGDIPEAVEDGASFAANARIKARFYAARTGRACLADDSGLEVDVLNGAPGVYSARYAGPDAADAANNAKLCRALESFAPAECTGRFRCALAFVDTDGTELTAEGVCEGLIRREAAGTNGFGYDPYFYVPELRKTLAEISVAAKNQISHRGRALDVMAARLAEYFR